MNLYVGGGVRAWPLNDSPGHTPVAPTNFPPVRPISGRQEVNLRKANRPRADCESAGATTPGVWS